MCISVCLRGSTSIPTAFPNAFFWIISKKFLQPSDSRVCIDGGSVVRRPFDQNVRSWNNVRFPESTHLGKTGTISAIRVGYAHFSQAELLRADFAAKNETHGALRRSSTVITSRQSFEASPHAEPRAMSRSFRSNSEMLFRFLQIAGSAYINFWRKNGLRCIDFFQDC